jgi:hypothetical protein
MFRRARAKRVFQVSLQLVELVDIPIVTGSIYAKWQLDESCTPAAGSKQRLGYTRAIPVEKVDACGSYLTLPSTRYFGGRRSTSTALFTKTNRMQYLWVPICFLTLNLSELVFWSLAWSMCL